MDKMSHRSSYWDNIKGFLIFLVVFAHCLFDFQDKELIGLTVKSIYLFHMPAFIFVSGFFGKGEKAHSEKSIAKLLFAYFIFDCITGVIMGWEDILEPVYSYWYILALVIWRVGAKYIPTNRTSLIIAFIASICVGFVPAVTGTLALSRVIGFFPFYLAGVMLSKEKVDEFRRAEPKKRHTIGFAALAAAVAVGYITIQLLDIETDSMLMDCYSVPFGAVNRAAMFVTAVAAIAAIMAFMPEQRLTLLTSFGRNSLPIFLFHRLITLAFSANMAGQRILILLPASLLAALLICLVFGNNTFGNFVARYLETGAELMLNQKNEEKSRGEYAAVKLSALAVIAAVLITSIIEM